jgi:hypothetical protein
MGLSCRPTASGKAGDRLRSHGAGVVADEHDAFYADVFRQMQQAIYLPSREEARLVNDPKLSGLLFELWVFGQTRDGARKNASFH